MKHILLLLTGLVAAPLALAQDELGKTTYATCSACHAPDGQGLTLGPTMKMAPALSNSKVANGDPAIFALVVLKGIQKDPTNTAIVGMMAPLGAALDDAKLAAVMTYVRASFGNKSAAVTEAEAKGYREQWKDINAPVTRAKIEELSKK